MDENKKVTPSEDTEPMEKEKRTPKISSARSKRGMYTAAVSALVIAIVIAFNLLVGGIPAGTLEYDISGTDLYTVTEQSVDYLKTLDTDVSIVVLAQSAAIDEHILKFLNNYALLSPHLTLQIIDPVLDPTAQTTYNAQENNVVVTCGATNRTKLLNLAGIIESNSGTVYNDGLILYDAQAAQYYGQLIPSAIDAEGQLTSAVDYVTSTATNAMYLLTGHSEAALGTAAATYVEKANIETLSLNLLTDGNIPADCQLIMCFNPAKDITGDELNMLETYLRTGGKLLLILDSPDLPNFNALLAVYGLQMQNGYVGDNDRNYQSLYQIIPVVSGSSDVTSGITANAFVRMARGMLSVTPERRGSTVTPFMTTSANGVMVVDQNNSTDGQFILGATVTETFDDKPGVETRLTVITAVDLLSDELSTGLANMDIFMNAVARNYTDVQNFSVPSKSLNVSQITVTNPQMWIALFVGIIPVAFLAGGLATWIKRRNR